MESSTIDNLVKAFEAKISSGLDESSSLELIPPQRAVKEEDIEMKFSLHDIYSKKLFIALARKHGYKPYRYPRQKHTTVILKGQQAYFDDVLWPQYVSLSQDLSFLLEQVTNEAVRTILQSDPADESPTTAAD